MNVMDGISLHALTVKEQERITFRREVVPMEELQKTLVAEIGKQLAAEQKNIQLLDVLNRLLGTVSNYLIR